MKTPKFGEYNPMREFALAVVQAVYNTRTGNRGVFLVNGRWEHHAEYTAGYMQAGRRGELVGVYSRKATVDDVLEDMRHELALSELARQAQELDMGY